MLKKKKKTNKLVLNGGVFFFNSMENYKNNLYLLEYWLRQFNGYIYKIRNNLVLYNVKRVNFYKFLTILAWNHEELAMFNVFIWGIIYNSILVNINYTNIELFMNLNNKIRHKIFFLVNVILLDLLKLFINFNKNLLNLILKC